MSFNMALLRALAPGDPVSGTALGRALGTSRTAIWKGIQRLVDLGLEVEAKPGLGYRLAAPLELLDAARLRRALPAAASARLARLEVLAETDSTNSRVLFSDAAPGVLVACLAEHQSAGRGRHGRAWLAAPGRGVCLSVGGRMPASPADFAGLPPAVGLACAEALERLGVPGVRLKWPNDLLLGDAKLGGILIELRGEAQGPATVAVGIGLNLHVGAPMRAAIGAAGGLPPAALADAAPDVGRNEVAAALLAAVVETLAQMPGGLGEEALAAWVRRDALRDRAVRLETPGRAETGIARGIDATGALLLETADGTLRRVTAGEVTLRPAA
ncbi:biotin--[acetyl-CoA-carboxylase] ligase [Thioalkalivibrio sp. XN279]|uniref:biotin--[acetyl-CoA-carboxylase] ligase n=1 Tax=Thioalkalivibrio sp. XN279 TaxID=2714953 RepID=UPI00140D29F4|nr:biotin--[acetyl-CoA-carboxylase] ligase [Thioalkalivibrio sp. XN279]NHA14257.1 biotin--[acetyl-CoA-carboxylase] ligase [Thioalkalivibrio sp. XN279]